MLSVVKTLLEAEKRRILNETSVVSQIGVGIMQMYIRVHDMNGSSYHALFIFAICCCY